MSSEWPLVTLENVTSRIGDGLHGTPKYVDNGDYYFINGNNLSNGRIAINEKTKRTDKEEYLKHKKNINNRTLFVSINGTLGNVAAYRDEKIILGKSACYLNVLPEVDRDYIKYVLTSKHFQDYIHNLATGSTIKNVGLKLIREYEFRLPVLAVQKKVANILNTIDFKIENNTQNNQTLEQIAKAIFKSWFVDFDPVKAKIEVLASGGSNADAELAAMSVIAAKDINQLDELRKTNPDAFSKLTRTTALFPAAMQDSEHGEIPEGWTLSEIGKEVTVLGGGTPSTSNPDFWENGDINWTTPKDMSNLSSKVLVTTDRKITNAGLKKISSGLLAENTVLMSSRAPVGYLALAKIPVAINQGYIAMKCEQQLTPEYVMLWCEQNMEEIKQRASGTTFAEISKSSFKPIPVLVPTKEVIENFTIHVEDIYKIITSNVLQTVSLNNLKDTLLPKLLSGFIDCDLRGV